MIKAQTLKGFRDFLPIEARKRQFVINTLKKVFESYGFEPLETPALEYEQILLGKYGDEGDKLMYRFEDNGKRKVALRYDQTVPLARVVAQYQNQLPMPFKRYQIQNVWRADNTQKGRYREFLQCDIDTVGSSSPLSDAEIIAIIVGSFKKLGFSKFKVLINDRENLKFSNSGVALNQDRNILAVRAIDKLKKIGKEGVIEELIENGFSEKDASEILKIIEESKPTARLKQVFSYLEILIADKDFYEFSPTLARGLDYYTSTILEVEVENFNGSLAGGGRYDNLIGMFTNKNIPAIGMAFGFDRVIDAMNDLNLFPKDLQTAKVLVTIFPALSGAEGSKDLKQQAIDCSLLLRSSGVQTELYLDENAKMEKQLKYADKKQIPYAVIIGPDEAKNNTITLKNMKTRGQKTIPISEAIKNFEIDT